MPQDFGKWGFLVLIILIAGPLLFWLIALLINWGKWAFVTKKQPKIVYADMVDIKNPVSKNIQIDFTLGMVSDAQLVLLDENFKIIDTLLSINDAEGNHQFKLDSTKLENDEYFVQLITDNRRITKKIVVAN